MPLDESKLDAAVKLAEECRADAAKKKWEIPFKAGDEVKFEGTAASPLTISGSFPVKIINPHSNSHKMTHYDNRGRPYEGAFSHIPTATVERPERKGAFPSPARQFEAHHFTLRK
jgi:hypothetical protein